MQSKQWDRAKQLFLDAADKPPAQRRSFLSAACGEDDGLRARVEALLDLEGEADQFLQTAREAAEHQGLDETPVTAEQPGARVGCYKLLQKIGEGGFGTVYMAEQVEPVVRRVALKVIKLGMDTRQVIARFEAERQALAMMDHPNIARVLDAGATQSGRPYFVMELVRGVSITKYCDSERRSTRDRLELFAQVCNAVQHAHQKGIIHRDIKPSNVMITLHDGKPVPKVIDFGIAKAVNARLTEKTLFTEYGQFIGTPAYMSPEQAEMSGLDVDTRSDIYSLGVLLYELLSGATPFDAARLREAGYEEMRRIIREEEPPRPSTRVSGLLSEPRTQERGPSPSEPEAQAPGQSSPSEKPIARAQGSSAFYAPVPRSPLRDPSAAIDIARFRRTDPASLSRLLRGDLDWIVMKCLGKDRQQRYETADGLAMDVQRYLRHEPVLAGPPGRLYRFRKYARRNKLVISTVGAIAASLIAGLTLATVGFVQATRQREAARRALEAEEEQRQIAAKRAEETNEVADFQAEMLSGLDLAEMAATLRDDLIAEVRLAKKARGLPPEQIESEIARLTDALTGANLTNVAINSVDAHILRPALVAIRDRFADKPAVQAALLQTVSETYRTLGLYDEALPPLREALDIRRETLGGEHPDTLNSLGNLGVLLSAQGNLDEAETRLRDALARGRRALPQDHPETLFFMHALGLVLHRQGESTEAETLFRAALDGRRRVFGDEDQETVASINYLGTFLMRAGNYAEAEPLLAEALERGRRVFGPSHNFTLSAINNLGVMLRNQGRLEEAEPYLTEVVQLCRKTFGDEHPNTGSTIYNLAKLLELQGKYAEAEQVLREALERARAAGGDDRPAAIRWLGYLGDLLETAGNLAEAETCLRDVVERRRRVLGRAEPDTLGALYKLARVLAARDKPAEAEPLYREALRGFEPLLGPTDWYTAHCRLELGQTLARLRRFREAEQEFLALGQAIRQAGLSSTKTYRSTLAELIRVCDAWHTAEPDGGHDAKAAEWRARLEELDANSESTADPEGSMKPEP